MSGMHLEFQVSAGTPIVSQRFDGRLSSTATEIGQ